MNGLRAAATFLTRVPLHPKSGSEAATPADGSSIMAVAVPWFPVVGAVLGAVQAGVYVGMSQIVTPLMAAVVSMAVLALITGAFHHDGLADMADAFGGGWNVEQRMEILKDSRLGTYGVTALGLMLLLEASSVAALHEWSAVRTIVVAHCLSRATAVLMMLVAAPAGDSGLGVDYLQGMRRPAVVLSVLAAAGLTVALFGLWAVPVLAATVLAGLSVVGLAKTKIGGITGDVLGAVQQISKAAILVVGVVAV